MDLEKYFAIQLNAQEKCSGTKYKISGQLIKMKASTALNEKPSSQEHVTHWETKEDPGSKRSLNRLQTFIKQVVARAIENKQQLEDCGIASSVNAATQQELCGLHALAARLEGQFGRKDIESIANFAQNQDAESRVAAPTAAPTLTPELMQAQANPVAANTENAQLPQMLLANQAKATPQIPTIIKTGGAAKNSIGRVHGCFCTNCGVQLLPGRCRNGCKGIATRKPDLPFPTQEQCNLVTWKNRKRHPAYNTKFEDEWGKKWEEVTRPSTVAQERAKLSK